jgi:hypothetical protein
MERPPFRLSLGCRGTRPPFTTVCLWAFSSFMLGIGAPPLSVAAQADLRAPTASPFLSPGLAQPSIDWSQSQSQDGGSSRVWKGALLGAGIGIGVALAASEIFQYCDPADNSATYTCTISYGPIVLLGAGAGALLGAAIGKFTGSSGSSQGGSPVPTVGPSLDGGWALSLSIPTGDW